MVSWTRRPSHDDEKKEHSHDPLGFLGEFYLLEKTEALSRWSFLIIKVL